MKTTLRLIRIKQWLKNGLIFFPLIFGKKLTDFPSLIICLVGFANFCLLSSIVYIINDINDIESDRKHPVKRNRPLASGEISVKTALCIAFLFFICTIITSVYLVGAHSKNSYASAIFRLIYLLINLGYSFGLKNIPILDVCLLALGFLIRVLYGGVLVEVEVSNWLYLTVLTFAFYLGFGKRRNENKKISSGKTRAVLNFYTNSYMEKNMVMFMTLGLVFYSLWASESNIHGLVWTVPIVFMIVLKYNLLFRSRYTW